MRLRLPHRHLTLERYELALEERPARARRMRERAARCQRCLAELSQAPLGPVLAAWQMPAGATEWRRAVRRALTPAVRGPAAGPARRRRLAAAPAAAAALALLAAVPATANATPASPLFAVRGLEEEARWSLTITFSSRVQLSVVQFVEPVQTEEPSRTTYLWCIRSGTPGTDRLWTARLRR